MTPRERATVLAALRWWARTAPIADPTPLPEQVYLIEHGALGLAELDELCKRLALHQATGLVTEE